MKIAHATHYDLFNSRKWPRYHTGHCGTTYYKAKALENQGVHIEYIGPLEEKYHPIFKYISKAKNRWYKQIVKKSYHRWAESFINKSYGLQISQKLSKVQADIALCPDVNLAAYLECKQAIVFWTDISYIGLVDFYHNYKNLCRETIQQLQKMDRLALEKCSLAIFSSEWAAQTVIDAYQVNPDKVKAIPSGANIEGNRTLEDVKILVEARPRDKCKLLFLGVDWVRKGGDIALAVARELQENGLNVELTIVGCQPFQDSAPPKFVINPGFISKSTEAGLNKINSLIAESHFLILPSRAEAYGNVFCEANSFGIPCLATTGGGITTIIKENLNGKLFQLEAEVSEYCNYISNKFDDYDRYKQLALSSFNEYETRLNWQVAGKKAKQVLSEII